MSSAKYITREGYNRLEQELRQLWKEERPAITKSVQEAAAQGDRSENADYIYGKRRLREIDRRVRYLTQRLDGMTIVDRLPDNPDRIYFGAWVTVEDQNGQTHRWRIVGADELDPSQGHISIDSPVARALLGHHEDDEVTVATPQGKTRYTVTLIEYKVTP